MNSIERTDRIEGVRGGLDTLAPLSLVYCTSNHCYDWISKSVTSGIPDVLVRLQVHLFSCFLLSC